MNVTVRHLKANSAVVSWDVLEDEVVIGFAISQQVTLEGPWEGRNTSREKWWMGEEGVPKEKRKRNEEQERWAESCTRGWEGRPQKGILWLESGN